MLDTGYALRMTARNYPIKCREIRIYIQCNAMIADPLLYSYTDACNLFSFNPYSGISIFECRFQSILMKHTRHGLEKCVDIPMEITVQDLDNGISDHLTRTMVGGLAAAIYEMNFHFHFLKRGLGIGRTFSS